jgi:hypothetical protein
MSREKAALRKLLPESGDQTAVLVKGEARV